MGAIIARSTTGRGAERIARTSVDAFGQARVHWANRELLVLATGAGSLILSHVNDAGFWLVE